LWRLRATRPSLKLAEEYHVHPNQISEWKKQLLEHGADIFSPATEKRAGLEAREREELIHTIGHQAVIIDWLKKRLGNEDYRSG
jgi:transposase-like protein